MKQTIEIEVPEGKRAVLKDNTIIFEDIKPQLPITMTTIKIDLEEQIRWYYWYNIISNRYPNAGIDYVIKQVNEIVYKK